MEEIKKGDLVQVDDPGLRMLQQFAPPGSAPNNVGVVDYIDNDLVFILFPNGDHSQLAPYSKDLVEIINSK